MGQSKSSRSSRRAYAILEPRVRQITEAAVRKKWKKLAPGPQDNVKQLLLALKTQSMVPTGKVSKIAGSEAIVEEVAQKLMQRLPRMPFPPRTEESHFDFEATLDRVRLLESQLTSNLNSMNLLRAQIAKEEKMLLLDHEELEALEDGSRSSQAIRKKQNKTLHPLARTLNTDLDHPGTAKSDETILTKFSILELENDPQVQPLLKQVHDHLESMHNNTAGTRDIEQVLEEAEAALDMFTSTTLDRKQHTQLYGLDIT